MKKSDDVRHCSFCDRSQHLVALLIEKPGAAICNECVVQLSIRLSNQEQVEQATVAKDCTFCAFMATSTLSQFRSQNRRLISDKDVRICDECLSLCNDILVESNAEFEPVGIIKEISQKPFSNETPLACSFCGQPHTAKSFLIPGQNATICTDCVVVFKSADLHYKVKPDGTIPLCAFCATEMISTAAIFGGPEVAICENCMKICTEAWDDAFLFGLPSKRQHLR